MSDLFAPPTEEEIADPMFAPPSTDELRDDKPSALESGFRGGIEGLSLGIDDEAGGHLEALGSKIGLRGLGSSDLTDIRLETDDEDAQDYREVYEYMRDKRRAEKDVAQAMNPTSYKAGEITGGILPAAASRGKSVFGPGVGGMIRGGAAGGGAAGFGYSEGDDWKDILADTVSGAAMGGAGGAVIGGAMSGLGKLFGGKSSQTASSAVREGLESKQAGIAESAKDLAERRAFKASTGQNKRAFKEAWGDKGGEVNRRGRELLDEGVVKFGDSVSEIADRSKAKLKELGPQLGKYRESVDELVPEGAVSGQRIQERILDLATEYDIPGTRHYSEKLLNIADEFGDDMTMATAAKSKQGFSPKSYIDKLKANLPDELNQKVRKIIKEESEGAIEETLEPGSKAAYIDLKHKYGRIKEAGKTSSERELSDLSNRFMSPSDHAMGMATFLGNKAGEGGMSMAKNALMGFGAAAANKIARARGSSAVAVGADKLSQVLGANPSAMGKYAESLLKAVERGPSSLGATHFILWKNDPEYRETVERGLAEGVDSL